MSIASSVSRWSPLRSGLAGAVVTTILAWGAVSPDATRADGPVPASPAPGGPMPDARQKSGERTFALLIGCTEYPELAKQYPALYESKFRLKGCVNDVELMAATLEARFRVPKGNIRTLAGWPDETAARPTEANVRRALEDFAARKYEPGDRVVIQFSGHGVQQADDDGDEADGKDEAWLLADGRTVPGADFAGTLRDDEIGRLVRAIRARGASVWCIMDCCHSATGMRGAVEPDVRMRGIDPALVGIEWKVPMSRGTAREHEESPMDDAGAGDGAKGLVVFYAAQSHQTVPEVAMPDGEGPPKSFGLLTSAVVRGLGKCGDQLTYTELFEQVVAGYRDLDGQRRAQPLAEGDLTPRIFGGGDGLPPQRFVRKIGSKLEFSAGALSGLAVGTELDVFPLGTDGTSVAALGSVVLTELRPEASVVRPVEGSDAAWTKAGGPWRAEITKFLVGDTGLPLLLVNERDEAASVPVPEGFAWLFRDDPAMSARFPLVTDPRRAKWLLVLDGEGRPRRLAPARRMPGTASFAVTADTLRDTLLAIFRGESLLKLSGADPAMGRLPGNLDLAIRMKLESGESVPVVAGQRVVPGSVLQFSLVKRRWSSAADVEEMDVWVFWVDPYYGVDPIFPDAKNQETARLGKEDVIQSGGAKPVGREEELTSDVSQGEERFIVFAAPKQDDKGPLDLSYLRQLPLKPSGASERGASKDGAAGFLDRLAFNREGARSPGPVSRATMNFYMRTYTIQTRWNALHAPREAVGAPKAPHARVVRPAPARGAGAPPDAWTFGPDVHLAQAGAGGHVGWCLLVAQEEGPTGATNLLLDLDGRVEGDPPSVQTLETIVAGGPKAFDAEIAVRIERAPKRTLVWYDTDDDGTFDRVLIDADDDLRAEERYDLKDGTWAHRTGGDDDLVGTNHFAGMDRDRRRRAVNRLRTIAGD